MAPPSATSLPGTAQLPPDPSGVANLAGADGSGESNPDADMPDSQGGSDSVPSADPVPHSRSPPHCNPVDSDADETMPEEDTKDTVDAGTSLDIPAYRPLDLADLEGMLNSTLIRREFASILSHYNPDGLAQKIFASTTFLKRLLAKFRQLRAQVDPSNDTAVQNMLDAQRETTRGSPFATLAGDESDEEEKNHSGDQGDGAQGKSTQDDKNNEIDLTHQDSGASEPSSRKTTPIKKKGSRDQARSPSNQLMFPESDVREIMKNEPVVWDTLRPDVILLMRAGIGYQGSIAMLNGDVMTHNLFPPSELADMLTSMMFWNRLDESFWTKYVPEKYYLRAELRLDLLHSEGVMDDGSIEHDDTQHDANYNPYDDVGNKDDDEVQGEDSVPSAPKRRRTSVSSHSDIPATQSKATPSKRARSGSMRRQSPLA
ncbi:hypothetical protein PHMEG_00032031 [Phytophthora megakarya]|uniref:Uncharacterized protein n=1 Tax=Phytophthora megakarya TaxID=4795 RepID=A0A225UWM9_9STRA|nr:hypothetical protein PHMEG_00032031 [Phytophthora megakarya]